MSRFNVGGTSQWLFHLCKGLNEGEIENLLIIGNCPDYEIEDGRVKQLQVTRVSGLNPSSSIGQSIQAFLNIRKIIKSYQPDLINTHASKGGFIGRIAALTVRGNSKIIHTYHGHVMRGYFSWPKQTIIQTIEFTLSFVTDAYIVVGNNVLTELRKLRIIRNQYATSVNPAVTDFSEGKQKTSIVIPNIPAEKLVVGWLGRKVRIKRIDRILELATLRPDLHFIIAGVGNSIFTSHKDKFIGEEFKNVTEIGYILPSEFWPLCDISILTSDNEGIPSAPIEAALFEVPTITTNAGSAGEVVVDGFSGFIATELSEWLEKIDLLTSNPELRKEMGKNARKVALDCFDSNTNFESQLLVYRAVLTSCKKN